MAMLQFIRRFLSNESGTTAIEYGLICGLIFLAIVGGVTALGTGVSNMLYDQIQTAL